jgi:hypothetical protein
MNSSPSKSLGISQNSLYLFFNFRSPLTKSPKKLNNIFGEPDLRNLTQRSPNIKEKLVSTAVEMNNISEEDYAKSVEGDKDQFWNSSSTNSSRFFEESIIL